MPKTKRKKQNRSPSRPFKNSIAQVLEGGLRIAVAGHRTTGKQVPNPKAKPVFIGREYTGVPRGKQYPYAGAKRGGPTLTAVAAQNFSSRLSRAMKRVLTN